MSDNPNLPVLVVDPSDRELLRRVPLHAAPAVLLAMMRLQDETPRLAPPTLQEFMPAVNQTTEDKQRQIDRAEAKRLRKQRRNIEQEAKQ